MLDTYGKTKALQEFQLLNVIVDTIMMPKKMILLFMEMMVGKIQDGNALNAKGQFNLNGVG